MFKKILGLNFVPLNRDVALLALRVITGITLLLKHGWEKTFEFPHTYQMAVTWQPPFDPIGIGVLPTLLFAALADGICAMLLIVGVATRWSALIIFVNIFVAWATLVHFAFYGPRGDHGELIVLYLGATIALFFTGAGKYSIDQLLFAKQQDKA